MMVGHMYQLDQQNYCTNHSHLYYHHNYLQHLPLTLAMKSGAMHLHFLIKHLEES